MITEPLSQYKYIHFVGIKGAGMTALAELLSCRGASISGSDSEEVFFTDSILKKIGITPKKGFAKKHISDNVDLVVYSSVYSPEKNVELIEALKKNIPILSYPQALGALTQEKLTLAVCGTHGKTTTSALLADTLKYSGNDPSAIVGSRIMNWGGNAISGTGTYLVIEADEYQDKLALYTPFAVILTSVDWDHPDFFPDVESYERVFSDFVSRIPPHGILVYCADSSRVVRIAEQARCRKVSYGSLKGADFQVVDYTPEKTPFAVEKNIFRQSFSVKHGDGVTDTFRLQLAGIHNALNATAVFALLSSLRLTTERTASAFEKFLGTERRFEYIGERYGAFIYDDYAHHPEEIRATLLAFHDVHPDKRLTVIFHPHTFTRTKTFLTDFAQSFDDADRVIILDIYGSVREKQGGVSSHELVALINRFTPGKAEYASDMRVLMGELEKTIGRQDVIITMGAGNVWEISHQLARREEPLQE